jgi:predicted acylesterase/phospholipase RssA
MKLLSFSGGSTKISSFCARGKIILESGYQPDIVAGLSSGALVIVPLLLGKHEMLKERTTNLKLSDIFDKNPVNEKGKVTIGGYARGLTKGSFGSMKNLEKTIQEFVTREEFYNIVAKKDFPLCYAGITNVTNNEFKLVLLNNLTYEGFIKTLIASATIPLYTPPIKIGKEYYYDGGLIHHNPAIEVLRKYKTTITECISVYSRPQDVKDYDPGYDGKSLGRNLSKTLEILQLTISKQDELSEIEYCEHRNIKLKQYFSPKIMKGVYDVDPERLKLLYDSIK